MNNQTTYQPPFAKEWGWRSNLEAMMGAAMVDWYTPGACSTSTAQTYAQCVTALNLGRIADALERLQELLAHVPVEEVER